MSNPFSKPDKPLNPQLRNTYDLSFANNLTLDFGQLVPVFCKEVLPGDTFRINTTFGLRAMPTAFPIQSRVRADLHFFYVRNRNLWSGWQEFITNSPEASKQKPFPTISPSKLVSSSSASTIASTCKLGDYLGLPTTLSGRFRGLSSLSKVSFTSSPDFEFCNFPFPLNVSIDGFYDGIEDLSYFDGSVYVSEGFTVPNLFWSKVPFPGSNSPSATCNSIVWYDNDLSIPHARLEYMFKNPFFARTKRIPPVFSQVPTACLICDSNSHVVHQGFHVPSLDTSDYSYFFFGSMPDYEQRVYSTSKEGFHFLAFAIFRDSRVGYESPAVKSLFEDFDIGNESAQDVFSGEVVFTAQPNTSTKGDFPYPRDLDETLKLGFGKSPYTDFPVSALPFRAYESIYNAFYRDERNNPLIDDETHVQVYNRTLLNVDGGLDSFPYQIRFRNWEQDFLTTAMPTPQQGIAPLVGLTTGAAVFMDPDTGKKYSAEPVFGEDGETLVSAKFTEDIPGSVARSLVQVASSGISINDFRNVNSLQRYLENNLRNGLRYIDNLKMRWGVNPSYATMDMPEFIGGVSQPIQVSQVTQTSDGGSDSPLGSYAGQLSAIGSAKRSVTHHCDEHGFIIGILSVVPVPVYSTLLPKFFTKTAPLDYFTPEFGHIGLQPIPYREVAPILVANDPDVESDEEATRNLSHTFGYQLPWYDYLASVDEVHGLFRTNLKDFLLHRVFDSVPHLDPSFLLVNPDSLTDIFSASVGGNKLLGQIYFDVKAKRPIPRFSTPRLE